MTVKAQTHSRQANLIRRQGVCLLLGDGEVGTLKTSKNEKPSIKDNSRHNVQGVEDIARAGSIHRVASQVDVFDKFDIGRDGRKIQEYPSTDVANAVEDGGAKLQQRAKAALRMSSMESILAWNGRALILLS